MTRTCKSFSTRPSHTAERGNAMVYVLIVVALFAALGFLLSRQGGGSDSGDLSAERADIFAAQIMQTPMQIKQAIDQMLWTGATLNYPGYGADRSLSFVLPGEPGYETAPHVGKVFHPNGGGLTVPRLEEDAIDELNQTPAPGWYIGRFNDVEWSESTEDDVIATAHQISERICARINERLTGSATIPELGAAANRLLIDVAAPGSTGGSNIRFTSAECAECYGKPSLCVKDNGVNAWSYYSIIATE